MAYTVSDLTSAIQDDLKDSSFSSTRILRYLNRAQWMIYNTHFFKFCETSVTGALTVGEHTYEQQSDHQSTIGGVLVDPGDATRYVVLDERSYLPHREFFEQHPLPGEQDNAMPSTWTEYGDQIYFDCPVDEAYLFTQRYFKIPTELDDSADVPAVPYPFREALELYCLYRAEKYRGNHDVAATYKQDFEDELEAMTLRYSGPTQIAAPRIRQRRVRTGDY